MDNNIIPIHEEHGDYPVNGRELHEKLGVETQYSKWIHRMLEYGFEAGKDFETVVKNVHRADGTVMPQTQTDYNLTLSMAKEICMLQRTEQGKAIRRYLISVEEAWNTPEKVMSRALQMADRILAGFKDEVKALAEKNAEMLPKAQFYDTVTGSTDTIDMAQAAKVLNMGIGRNTLFKILRSANVLQHNNVPYQEFVDRGYFRCIESSYSTPDGTNHVSIKTVVFQKGLDFIRKTVQADRDKRCW